jgi:asparagine synthase (glutamine-hydrolysing)
LTAPGSAMGGNTDGGPVGAPELLRALSASVADSVRAAGPISLLFSGGLDSSLIAWLLPPDSAVALVAVGVEGAADLAAAQDAAERLHRPLKIHLLRRDDIRAAWSRLHEEVGHLREPARSVAIAFAMATEAAEPGTVLCGQGADELFYGYAHFRGLPEGETRRRAVEDLARLTDHDWPRALRIGRRVGRDLRAPYLDARVRTAATGLAPPGPAEVPKIALRQAAALAGLPTVLVDRPKRALQYGSGVARVVATLTGDAARPPG